MAQRAPKLPQTSPQKGETVKPSVVSFDGREYPLLWERGEWRLRSRSKKHPANFRTGTGNEKEAQRRAKKWLEEKESDPIVSRRGGGNLEGLAAVYLELPKKTRLNVAEDNISRLRTICRTALGKELEAVTCREVGPELWEKFQRAALAKHGLKFDLVTRYRQNISINSAVRAARCLFLDMFKAKYRAQSFDLRDDAGAAVLLPEPYVPPSKEDDEALVKAWRALPHGALWLTIGIGRFAGLRREEIANARVGWLEERGGTVVFAMRDRPEESFWIKTGKVGRPYAAQVIDPELSVWLLEKMSQAPADSLLVPDPKDGGDRDKWFEGEPQQWLRAQGFKAAKPLHRLRGLYADHMAKLTEDAVTARLAGIKAAQQALGHTTDATTKKHYLSGDAVH